MNTTLWIITKYIEIELLLNKTFFNAAITQSVIIHRRYDLYYDSSLLILVKISTLLFHSLILILFNYLSIVHSY